MSKWHVPNCKLWLSPTVHTAFSVGKIQVTINKQTRGKWTSLGQPLEFHNTFLCKKNRGENLNELFDMSLFLAHWTMNPEVILIFAFHYTVVCSHNQDFILHIQHHWFANIIDFFFTLSSLSLCSNYSLKGPSIGTVGWCLKWRWLIIHMFSDCSFLEGQSCMWLLENMSTSKLSLKVANNKPECCSCSQMKMICLEKSPLVHKCH